MSEQLIERARRGDADAFVALIEERQVAMTRVATAILRDPADVADALQETLVSLWRELPRLRDSARFEAWADRILVNACRLVLRRRSRRSTREFPMPDADQRPSGTAQATDQIVERDAFDRAFETLDAQERSLIVLHHLEDRPLAEIAAVLRIPVGTAKSRLFSARRRLETALAREDGPVAGRLHQDGTAR